MITDYFEINQNQNYQFINEKIQFKQNNSSSLNSIKVEWNQLYNRSTITNFISNYPLKLMQTINDNNLSNYFKIIYLLGYGGGTVSRDQIQLFLNICHKAALIILTPGSMKIYKRSNPNECPQQNIFSKIESNSTLLYLPTHTVPFANSAHFQSHIVDMNYSSNLMIFDSMSSGRYETNEQWKFDYYESFNLIRVDQQILIRERLRLGNQHVNDAHLFKLYNAHCLLLILGPRFYNANVQLYQNLSNRKLSNSQDVGHMQHNSTRSRPRSLISCSWIGQNEPEYVDNNEIINSLINHEANENIICGIVVRCCAVTVEIMYSTLNFYLSHYNLVIQELNKAPWNI